VVSVTDRVGVVTGAGRGLGRAHALALAAAGASVVVNDSGCELDGSGSDPSLARSVVAEIESRGGRAVANVEPVGRPEVAERLVALALDTWGRLDFLVNNAGISRAAPLTELDHALWQRILDTHLGGTFTCTQAAFAAMTRANRGGRILNTTSGAGLGRAYPGSAAYASAKGAIAALTRVVAAEGAKHGITCNAVSPLARTRMSGAFLEGTPDGGGVENVSALVVYLASAASEGVTGQIFRAAEGRLAVYEQVIPEGCPSRAGTWTADEIAGRIDEILTREKPVHPVSDRSSSG